MGPRGTAPNGGPDTGGVDLYVGGVEHAVLHLLYARFWHKVLFDLGEVSSDEPFRRLFNQGYVQAYAYRDDRGQTVPAAEVEEGPDGTWTWQGQTVVREYGKMGKSLNNIVTPDDMYDAYGADTFRVYEMSMGPLDASRPWETRAVVGSLRFLQRLWRNVVDEETGAVTVTDVAPSQADLKALHRAIDGITRDYAEPALQHRGRQGSSSLNNHLTKPARRAAVARRGHGADDRARRAAPGRGACGSASGTAGPWRTSPSRWPTRRTWSTTR
ncbi:hypothetical protein GCM10025868_09120 [Angustibacter aerolatus]|uniref:leucine--tRNA ligase n=1 Tax=Angustibacter aerolatus TaxID=1162965 RepID=A0ABQ6JBX1_9ACTN|nr:hypothetical protein [Angustibacter aerolatus]GMA85662.1 hypothetical protein GCM10025868_09120 [Angustibacter aerolatus]